MLKTLTMVLYPRSPGNLGDPRCPEHLRCTRSLGSDKKLTLGSPLLKGGRVLKLDKILVYWKSWKSCEFWEYRQFENLEESWEPRGTHCKVSPSKACQCLVDLMNS